MQLEDFLATIRTVTGRECGKKGSRWSAHCPAHEDREPSLNVKEDGSRLLVKCHAGCTVDEIVKVLGLKTKDLFTNDGQSRPKSKRRIAEIYDYVDSDGKLLFQVVRYKPKSFRQRRPDPNSSDKWFWDLKGVQRVLYRLPDVLEAVAINV